MGVRPDLFAQAVSREWIRHGNHLNPALQPTWHKFATTLNQAMHGLDKSTWKVLALPTGTGKTLGLATYCALLDLEARNGVWIAVRTDDQADELVSSINGLAHDNRAIAYHGEAKTTLSEARAAPVLVITHSAHEYARAAILDGNTLRSKLADYACWAYGNRNLFVIDEAPSLVRHHQTTLQDIALLHGAIRNVVKHENQPSIRALDSYLTLAHDAEGNKRNLSQEEMALLSRVDADALIENVQTLDPEVLRFNNVADPIGSHVRNHCLLTLRTLTRIKRLGWAWTIQKGEHQTVNSSEQWLCSERDAGVILDATAMVNASYGLLGSSAEVIQANSNIRSYTNVTLHVSRNQRPGKAYLTKHIHTVWPRVLASLQKNVQPHRKVLVLCHKSVEHIVRSYETNYSSFEVAHYGAIDGKNDWSGYDTICVLGLPYLDSITPTSTALAFIGPQTDDWLTQQTQDTDQIADIRQTISTSHTLSGLLQGINRGHCRRTVDSAGNCAPTDIFLLLPKHKMANALVAGIEQNMPGICLRNWDIELVTRKLRSAPSRNRVLEFFELACPGTYTRDWLISELGLSKASLDRFIRVIRDTQHDDCLRLAALGVRYFSCRGRNGNGHFLKSAGMTGAS